MSDENKGDENKAPKSPPSMSLAGITPTSPSPSDEVMEVQPQPASIQRHKRERDQPERHEYTIPECLNKIAFLRNEMSKQRSAILSDQREYTQQQALQLSLKQTIRAFEDTVKELEIKNATLQVENTTLQSTNNNLERRISELRSTLTTVTVPVTVPDHTPWESTDDIMAREAYFDPAGWVYIYGSKPKKFTHPSTPGREYYQHAHWEGNPYYLWEDQTARIYGTTMIRATEDMINTEYENHQANIAKANANKVEKRAKGDHAKGAKGGKGGKGGKGKGDKGGKGKGGKANPTTMPQGKGGKGTQQNPPPPPNHPRPATNAAQQLAEADNAVAYKFIYGSSSSNGY